MINSSICTDATKSQNESSNSKGRGRKGGKKKGKSLETYSAESRCFEFVIDKR